MLIRKCMTCSKTLGYKTRIPFYKTFTAPIQVTHGLCNKCLHAWRQNEQDKRNMRNFGLLSVRDQMFHLFQREIRGQR